MNFIDKEDVPLLKIGEERGKVARLSDHRPRGHLKIHTKLARHDLGKRRLSEARRSGEQHVIQRLAPPARGVDENLKIGACLRLPDEFSQALRAERKLARVLVLPFAI